MKSNLTGILLALILLTIFSSCRKDFDFSKDFGELDSLNTSITMDGSVAAPILNATFSLQDVNYKIQTENFWIETDDDSLIHMMASLNISSLTSKDIIGFSPIPEGVSIPAIDVPDIENSMMDIGFGNLPFDADWSLNEPSIKVIVTNYVGVKLDYKINSIAFYDEEQKLIEDITNSPINEQSELTSPTQKGDSAVTIVELSPNTVPTLGNILGQSPGYLSTSVKVTGPAQTIPFTMDGTEALKIAVKIDIPLAVTIRNLEFKDTLDFNLDLESIGGEGAQITGFLLKSIFDNGFPINLKAQVYFAKTNTDNSLSIVDSLFYTDAGYILKAAQIDDNGIATESTQSFVNVDLEQKTIDKLKNEKPDKVIVKFNISTTDADNNTNVKILSTYSIGLKMGAKIDYKVTSPSK